MYLEECVKLSGGFDMVKTSNEALENLNNLNHNYFGFEETKEQFKKEIQEELDKYFSLGCGKDLVAEKCVYANNRIKSLTSTIASVYQQPTYNERELRTPESYKQELNEHKLFFDTNGCAKKIEEVASVETSKVINKFTALDTARITADTTYQVQQKVLFGGLILVAGLVILTMFNEKK